MEQSAQGNRGQVKMGMATVLADLPHDLFPAGQGLYLQAQHWVPGQPPLQK